MSQFNTIDDFELGKGIGFGQFGQVWLARHKKHDFICALKIIDLDKFKENNMVKNIRREIEIHLNIRHPNIIGMYGYFYDAEKLYCVLEYAGQGDLYGLLDTKEKLEETETRRCIKQVTEAVAYLHRENIIHRDIKPENILLGCDGTLKLGDFGWSVYNSDKKRGTFCGTPDYLSPEICEDKKYTKAVDVWCLGILCYELLAGTTPFVAPRESLRTKKEVILKTKITYPEYFSIAARDFIACCTRKDPSGRMTAEEALKHPFLK